MEIFFVYTYLYLLQSSFTDSSLYLFPVKIIEKKIVFVCKIVNIP